MAVSPLLLLTLLLAFSSLLLPVQPQLQGKAPQVPALYIFGDSTVDGGNQGDGMEPYGLDLKNTTLRRRFSNGLNIADFIANYLNLPLVPPINSTDSDTSVTGINYAYGGTGLLPETFPARKDWSLGEQISKFSDSIVGNLNKSFPGQAELADHLAGSIYLVSVGINDYNNNYLVPTSDAGSLPKLSPPAFAQFLQNKLSASLTTLYGLGARKFVVNNIWPLGCTPLIEKLNPSNDPLAIISGCNETANLMVLPYSATLPAMLKKLELSLPGAVFSHSNNFKFVDGLKLIGGKYGITNTTGECYVLGTQPSTVCPNRDAYLYFDLVHTTEAANRVFATNCCSGSLCVPNVAHLAGLGD